MIIATAGHVDHGKTTLLQAISGINADRLPEEKRRGMTIDLGYAYWPQPDGRVLGFIDVPGHEKFLANMLAGVGGIDHALLVVACDDGVMAQTREHLAILRLSGRPALTVALTKADRVEAARVDEVCRQVRDELARQGWPDAPLFVTAAAAGVGIEALRAHLLALSPGEHALTRRFRLAVDRAFSVKGAGLVVTGTALGGRVKVGDTLWLTGADAPVRVRGLHAQNQTVEHAQAGQRIALNISGDVDKERIARGDWLLAQRPPEAAERILVALETDRPDPPLAAAASAPCRQPHHRAYFVAERRAGGTDPRSPAVVGTERSAGAARYRRAANAGRGSGAQAECAQARQASAGLSGMAAGLGAGARRCAGAGA